MPKPTSEPESFLDAARRYANRGGEWLPIAQTRALVSIAESMDRIARAQEVQAAIAEHYFTENWDRDPDELPFRPIVDTRPL